MYYYDEDRYHFKLHCIGTYLKFVIWPRHCSISNKILCLKFVYKQTAMWSGPGDSVFEDRWYDKNEFLMARIKGIL